MLPLKPETRLDKEPMSAVLARVAFAVAARRWWDPKLDPKPDPTDFVSYLAREMAEEGWGGIATWLQSMAYGGRLGVPASRWRTIIVQRARAAQLNRARGFPWRRVPPCY